MRDGIKGRCGTRKAKTKGAYRIGYRGKLEGVRHKKYGSRCEGYFVCWAVCGVRCTA